MNSQKFGNSCRSPQGHSIVLDTELAGKVIETNLTILLSETAFSVGSLAALTSNRSVQVSTDAANLDARLWREFSTDRNSIPEERELTRRVDGNSEGSGRLTDQSKMP